MDFIEEELKKIKKTGLYRNLKTLKSAQSAEVLMNDKAYLNFCSNDYLGLANHPYVKLSAIKSIEKYGVGTGASRLICGNMELHNELEEKISKFKGEESCLVFSTGYMANTGVISTLLDFKSAVIIDRLDHASIIDGCRLSKAKMFVYPHRDIEALGKILERTYEFKRRLIVTDSVFSMDGDIAPLPDIIKVARKYNSMVMVDDAHATGVLGKTGKGITEHFNLKDKPDIVMGTLSKALGSLGGFICGSKKLIEYLKNKCRSFIYTTGLPVNLCAAALASIELIEKEPKILRNLWDNTNYLKLKLNALKLNTMDSQTPIIPVIIGNNEKIVEISGKILESGILIAGIRPPTVPEGTSRLRITVTAKHKNEQIDKLLSTLEKVLLT